MSFRYLVKDVDLAVQFYTKSLGFELKQQFGPAMAIVNKGELNLWLAGAPSSAAKAMPDGRKPEPGGWNRFAVASALVVSRFNDTRGLNNACR